LGPAPLQDLEWDWDREHRLEGKLMGNRSKYRRLPDLYIRGKELVFKDEAEGDVVMWLQVLNPFEAQECRNDAQVARSRLTMALRTEGSKEYDTLKGQFVMRTTEVVIEELISAKQTGWFMEAQHALDVDPDWTERMEAMRSADIAPAAPLSEDEQALLAKLNVEYMDELNKRIAEERDYYKQSLERMSTEDLLEEYLDTYIGRRGDNTALIEYNLTELVMGCRVCEAVPDEEGYFGPDAHKGCNHKERVFETREEVRELPEEMQIMLRTAFDDLAMSARDAKSSGSKASSSDSSPVPDPQEGSTPSTSPEPVPSMAPGT
jgi:hypothetical protein